uniref:Uncharacterized protein n=1 Tax=viral metagenome TaxID=1070528 RepID=A0A6C0IT17_9ZZZZ
MTCCYYTCMLSFVFIFAMIYFYNATTKSRVVELYKSQLPPNLRQLYNKLANERLKINYYGYTLGFGLALIAIFYNGRLYKLPFVSLLCLTIVISFSTNYFFYILYPKSDWMLKHINSPEQTKAWLQMYRSMQYHYHLGLALGLIAVGLITYSIF